MKSVETHNKSQFIKAIIAVLSVLVITLSMGIFDVYAIGDKAQDVTGDNPEAVSNGAVEIQQYNLNAIVHKDHSYTVVEKIKASLPDDTKSIDFEIPHGNFRVSGIRVENTDYETDRGGEGYKVTIVDEAKLTKGVHVYTIEYTVREFADRDTERDIFYFDAMLPDWSYPVSKVNIRIAFPADFPWGDVQYYAGQYGVQAVDSNVDFRADAETHTVTIATEKVPENFGITVKAELPDGYWKGALNGRWANAFMMLIMLAAAVIAAIMWIIGGRDPKIVKTIQTHPIEGVSPAEISYILSGRVHTRDIVALVIYMATKGYLRISEYQPKRYSLIREQYPSGEEKFIRNAYDILFEDIPEGRSVDMDELGPRLKRMGSTIKDDIAAGFSGKDMLAYTRLSQIFRIAAAIIYGLALGVSCAMRNSYQYLPVDYAEAVTVAFLAIATALLFAGCFDRQYFSESQSYRMELIASGLAYIAVPMYVAVKAIAVTGVVIPSVVVLLMSAVCGLFITIMRARAKGNAALTSRLVQLRHFIYHPTPKEVAQNYIADNNYYYEIVPYALLFKGLNAWAISFLTLRVKAPEWYSDDIEGHAGSTNIGVKTSVDYARDITTFYRTMIEAYRAMERSK